MPGWLARLFPFFAIILVAAVPASAEKRVALVIGNSAYQVGPLTNPVNDAAAIAKLLGTLGFDTVIHKTNLGRQQMQEALQELADAAVGADIALVFYAGHGTENAGVNYLIPIDAPLARATDLKLQAIGLDAVLDQIAGASRLRLVILDACRNNIFPLAGSQRSQTRGLARIEPEDNTLIAYAAKAGTTADDGSDANSPFTSALLKHLPTPGLDVRLLLGQVRDEVANSTGGAQQPHVYGTLGGQQIFIAAATAAGAGSSAPGADATELARLKAENEALKRQQEAHQAAETEAKRRAVEAAIAEKESKRLDAEVRERKRLEEQARMAEEAKKEMLRKWKQFESR